MDRDKLVSIAGMFGSSHDGERAAAALKADLLLKEEGLNWEAVLTPAYAAERCDLALELIVRGWPAKAAAGIAACLNVPEEGTAPNLAGWRDGRWNQFLDWSSAHGGRDPTDVGVQLDFLSHNLRGVFPDWPPS